MWNHDTLNSKVLNSPSSKKSFCWKWARKRHCSFPRESTRDITVINSKNTQLSVVRWNVNSQGREVLLPVTKVHLYELMKAFACGVASLWLLKAIVNAYFYQWVVSTPWDLTWDVCVWKEVGYVKRVEEGVGIYIKGHLQLYKGFIYLFIWLLCNSIR